MEKSIIRVIVLVVMVAFGSLLLAQNHQNCEMNKPGMQKEQMGKMEMKDELKLTDKQKDDIEKLRVNHRKEVIVIQSEIKTRNIDKMQALENADFAKAKTISKEIFDRQSQIAQKRIELHENIYKLLTAEQKEILKKNPRLMQRHGMCDDDMHQMGDRGPRGRMGKEDRMGHGKPEMKSGHCR
jgi:Spy/CpxP family protein refolding chaperone